MKFKYLIFITLVNSYSCKDFRKPEVDMNRVNESVKISTIESDLGNQIIKD
jgi:hypothetical protein